MENALTQTSTPQKTITETYLTSHTADTSYVTGAIRAGRHPRGRGLCETHFSQKTWRKAKGWAEPRHENTGQPRGYVNVAQSRLRPRSGPRAKAGDTGQAGPRVPRVLAPQQGFRDVTSEWSSVEAERSRRSLAGHDTAALSLAGRGGRQEICREAEHRAAPR